MSFTWTPEADTALKALALDKPTAQHTDYYYAWSSLRLGPEWPSPSAIRTRLYRMGLGSVPARVEARARERHAMVTEVERPDLQHEVSDKKVGHFDWREALDELDRRQELEQRASWSQDTLNFGYPEATDSVSLITLADWHLTSMCTNHRLAVAITDEILKWPDLRVAVVGDMAQMAIKLRGVAEVSDNGYSPSLQMQVIEGWLSELAPRIVAATWDNHAVEREEVGTGISMYAHHFSRRVAYFNGIGHFNFTVGQQTYHIVMSHKMRGRSENNPCHAQMKYLRFESHDREIALAGDTHRPGLMRYDEGGGHKIAVNTGSLQTSGFGKRYFSLRSHPVFPVITFQPHQHMATAFWNLDEWLTIMGRA